VLQIGIVNLFMLGTIYAYTFSAPAILIRLTGWNATRVGFLISGMSVLAAAGMVLNAMHSDRNRERHWHVAVPFLIIASGYLIGGLSMMAWLAVPAFAAAVIAHSSLQGPLLSIPPTFLKGKTMAAGIAAINTVGMLGGFIGPYWMGIAKDLTGDYQHGLLTLTIPSLAAAGIVLWMRRRASSFSC
jgi:ACS family tartrate transporter-like MFS transporter